MSKRRDSVSLCIDSMFSKISSSAFYDPKIFMVHNNLRQTNARAYVPRYVAIGPIHHNKPHLKPMEQLKLSYLQHFLQTWNEDVEKYVVKLRELEEKARNCYSNLIQLPKSDKFVEMLLLDGFFVIQLLRKIHFTDWEVENDYIFQSVGVNHGVRVDLLLFENQLPFFILSELFEMTKSNDPEDNLRFLVLNQLRWVLPWIQNQDVDFQMDDQNDDDHLLGMVYRAFFRRKADKQIEIENFPDYEGISAALDLEEAGIKFKTSMVNLTDITFTGDGVMCVPHLSIDDYTEPILRNLIAYEQMRPDSYRPVSDYIKLITNLVNTAKDAEILRRAGILSILNGDDEIVHHMFIQMGKHVGTIINDFLYTEVCDSVNKHCRRRRNRWMANLRRNYFNTPWATMSVIAAIILLILTLLQTVFTIIK